MEWYRDYLMTIRRQLVCCVAIVERKGAPYPLLHLSFPTWTSTQSQSRISLPRQAIGRLEDLLSVIGWRSTWGRRGGARGRGFLFS